MNERVNGSLSFFWVLRESNRTDNTAPTSWGLKVEVGNAVWIHRNPLWTKQWHRPINSEAERRRPCLRLTPHAKEESFPPSLVDLFLLQLLNHRTRRTHVPAHSKWTHLTHPPQLPVQKASAREALRASAVVTARFTVPICSVCPGAGGLLTASASLWFVCFVDRLFRV